MNGSDLNIITRSMRGCMTQRTVPANELAIKALRCPDGKARVVYHVDGHGNEGLKLYVESSGTKT